MISINSVSHSYDGQFAAVNEVSLEIASGELVALVGHSGSGKTTLLKLINRLLPLHTGTICINGVDTATRAEHELRRSIGYVFQGVGLFPHRRVAENVATCPRLLGWSEPDVRAAVRRMLSLVQLDPDDYGGRYPHELSGGQQQRVGVARALAASPSVVLMDEPFGAVDPLNRGLLQDEYRRIHNELSLTTVLVTHDMVEALLMADRIAVLEQGRLVQFGTPSELWQAADSPVVRNMLSIPREHAVRVERVLAGEETS